MIIHTCDICEKEIDNEFEIQEMFHLNHNCGYGSVFGDGEKVQYDICQDCMKKMLTNAKMEIMRKYADSLKPPPAELIKSLIERHNKEEETELLNCPKCGNVHIYHDRKFWKIYCDCPFSAMEREGDYTRNDIIKKWNEQLNSIKDVQDCLTDLAVSNKCKSCANLFKSDLTCFSCTENPAKTTLTVKKRYDRYVPRIVPKPPYRDNY